MMHVVDQHHDYLEEQCRSNRRDAVSISISVSRVAFVLAAIAFLSLLVSSSFALGAFSGPAISATRQLLATLCGFVTTKKALFILSNAIFLFLAADCSSFFGICMMAPTKINDHHSASELQPCVLVQVAQPCGSYSGSLYYHGSKTTNRTPENCSEEQVKRQYMPVSSWTPEPFCRLEGAQGNSATFLETVVVDVEEPACSGLLAHQELEKLEIDDLNRKFEEFIQSRRVKWIKEEEEVLQCPCESN